MICPFRPLAPITDDGDMCLKPTPAQRRYLWCPAAFSSTWHNLLQKATRPKVDHPSALEPVCNVRQLDAGEFGREDCFAVHVHDRLHGRPQAILSVHEQTKKRVAKIEVQRTIVQESVAVRTKVIPITEGLALDPDSVNTGDYL